MIHYSSINDAWGNKETFKNNKPQTDIKYNIDVEPSKNNTENNLQSKQINNVSNAEHIEHFACNTVEHLENCSSCKNKINKLMNKNPKTIELFGYTLDLTEKRVKNLLKAIFILLIILIIINLISLFYPTCSCSYYQLIPKINRQPMNIPEFLMQGNIN